jgi:hypothetical protein
MENKGGNNVMNVNPVNTTLVIDERIMKYFFLFLNKALNALSYDNVMIRRCL